MNLIPLGVGSVAAVSSIGSAIELLENDEWKKVSLMLIFLRYTYDLVHERYLSA